jgi:hypothetical protein
MVDGGSLGSPATPRRANGGHATAETKDMKGTFTPTYGVKVPFMRKRWWVWGGGWR